MPSIRPAAFAIALVFVPIAAHAQSAAERADALNTEGKELFAAQRYDEAYARFREATVLSPEGRFFFNMCFTLNYLERYADAIAACEQVEKSGADAALRKKTREALASLRKKLDAQAPGGGTPPASGDPAAPAGGDPAAPAGTDPSATGGAVAAASDPFATASNPEDAYKWSLGGELTGISNRSVGDADGDQLFAASGAGVRLFADFILSERRRFGVQAYFGYADLGPGEDNTFDERLRLVDLGGAAFKAFRLARRLYLTPLAGVHVSVQQIDTTSEGFIAVGARLEGSLAYVFGPSAEHAIALGIGANLYGPASGTVDGLEPFDFGLDHGSALVTVGLGYRFRFSTPFGSVPLIRLE